MPVNILSLNDEGIAGEAVEDGATLVENALKKARYAHERSAKWCMADDTGLYIDVLRGEPGIRAARWAGATASTEDIMRYTLQKLKDIPRDRRTATFRTAAVVITPTGESHTFIGEAAGRFTHIPLVQCQPMMPYSAIFVPDGQTKVWAEMSVNEENAISHRGKAFRLARDFIEKKL